MKEKKNKMQTIQVTLEEIKAATRPNVYRNKKKYTRKNKHKNYDNDWKRRVKLRKKPS